MTDADMSMTSNRNGNVNRKGSVVAVVVTYNRKVLLRECIEALLNQDFADLKIILVDNASTDGTHEYIWDLVDNEKVAYMNTGKNLGGAGGFNFGIGEAVKTGCDYIWIMDDDCIVHNDSLTALTDYAERIDNKFGYLSSVVRWTDGSICDMNVQRKGIIKSVKDFTKDGQKLMFASFVSLFLNRDAVEKCGLPIKEFFIWGDDWEYTSRIAKEYDCYLVPASTVTHKSASNVCVIVADSLDRIKRYYYAYRNESFLFKKLGLKGRLYFFAKIWYHRLRIVFSNTQHKREKLFIIKKGLKAAKTFKPQIEYIS